MALPAPGYLSNAERTNAEMKQALEDQRDFISGIVGAVSTLTASAALTAGQLGLVLIDASAGDLTVTLPEITPALGIRDVILRRGDNTGNRMVIQASGTDRIKFHTHLRAEGYPFLVLMGAGDYWHLRSDGAGNWWPVARRDEFPVGNYADGSAAIIPPGGYGLATGTVQAAQYPWLLDYAQQSGALCAVADRTERDGRWSISTDGQTIYLPAPGSAFRRLHDLAGPRGLGTYLSDALQGHGHELVSRSDFAMYSYPVNQGSGGGNASFYGRYFRSSPPGEVAAVPAISDGVNGAPRIANETRPEHVTAYPLIKLV